MPPRVILNEILRRCSPEGINSSAGAADWSQVERTKPDAQGYSVPPGLSAPVVHLVDVSASTNDESPVAFVPGEEVADECVRSVCSLTWGNTFAGLIGALALAIVLLGEVPPAPMIGWLFALTLSRVLVGVRSVRYVRASPESRNRQRRWFLVSEVIHGTIWGVSPFLFDVRRQRYEVFVVCTLLAVGIVSSLPLSPYLRSAISFTLPINLGLAVWMGLQGGRWGLSGAAGVSLIYGMTIAYVRAAHLLLKNAIVGRLENAHLADNSNWPGLGPRRRMQSCRLATTNSARLPAAIH